MILDPNNKVKSISFDIPVYDPSVDTSCITPNILGFAVEGSSQVLVGAEGMLEGVKVILNTGEFGIIKDGVAVIELNTPLVYGNEVYVKTSGFDENPLVCCLTFRDPISDNESYWETTVYEMGNTYRFTILSNAYPSGTSVTLHVLDEGLEHLRLKGILQSIEEPTSGVFIANIFLEEEYSEEGPISFYNGQTPEQFAIQRTVTEFDYCKVRSCSVFVSRISDDCLTESNTNPSGELTGLLVCNEKDMYRSVYDGDGGIDSIGVLAQEDCIYCGGNLPNCEEPPVEPTTFYNIVSCADNKVYQTITPLTVSNQRVSHGIHGEHKWNGTTQTTAPAYRGEVTILTGLTNCSTPTQIYYNIINCSDYQVYQTNTPIQYNNQRVRDDTYGAYRWNGTTTTVLSNARFNVIIMDGEFGCYE